MTTTAPAARPALDVEAPSRSLSERYVGLGWVRRFEWPLLLVIAAVAAAARAGGFSSGTLYRDDAWVALTSRVPLNVAARMVVTAPGFVLGERVWIGWFPHAVWADQLPTFLASVAGVVVVGRLARWWGLSSPASLLTAGIVAVALADVQYATRIKPYAFDLLAACLVLWLAERVRRQGARGAPWLAVASVAVCAFSLSPVPLVVGVWVVLAAEALVRRALSVRLVASGAATVVGLLALWLAVRGGVSPRLRTSWDGYYLLVGSPGGLWHSSRTIVDGFVAGIGVTTPTLGLHGLGGLDRAALLVLFVVGLTAWRRQLLPLAAVAAAVVLSVPSLVPLGTGRTDAYLYPAVAMVVAEGAARCWRLVRRGPRTLAVVVLTASLVFAGLLALDRVTARPPYPGGNFAAVSALVHRGLAQGDRVVIGGTARWPWTYYDVKDVRIVHSDLYNNGYTTLSDNPRVIVIPGSAIEGGYGASSEHAALVLRGTCAPVLYVESDDWPSMPMTLLHRLVEVGGLRVVSGPVVIGGYRVWTLFSGATCPPRASPSG